MCDAGVVQRCLSVATMSSAAAYKNVVRGKLNLKGKSTAPKVAATGAASASSSVSSSTTTTASTSSKRKKEGESAEERQEWEDKELARLLAQKAENESASARLSSSHAPQSSSSSAASSLLDAEKAAAANEADPDDDDTLTPTQRAFQRAQRKREADMIRSKIAAKTHRQRVEEYNEYLGKLSEHNDIPRVGPG